MRPGLPSRASAGPGAVKGSKANALELNDSSDEEFGTISDELAKERAKEEAAARQKELQAQKMRALQEQAARRAMAEDDDDDLEIVQDDMKSVAREEAKARQQPHGGARKIGEARKKQLQFATGRATVDLTHRPGSVRRTSDPAALLIATDGFAQPSRTGKKKTQEGVTNKADLNRLLLNRAEEERRKEIKKKEEAWMERGGKIKVPAPLPKAVDAVQPSTAALQQWAEKGRNAARKSTHAMDEDDEEGSDGDFRPDDEANSDGENAPPEVDTDDDLGYVDADLRGSASPVPETQGTEPADSTDIEDENADDENMVPRQRRPHAARRGVITSDDENDGDENVCDENAQPLGREPTWGNILVPETSLTQDTFDDPEIARPRLRRALSTLAMPETEETLETSTDKENDSALRSPEGMDRVRSPTSSGRRRSQNEPRTRSLWSDDEERITTPGARGEKRTPLGDITSPKGDDEEHPFSPLRSRGAKGKGNGFMERLTSLSPSKDDGHPLRGSALGLSPGFGGKIGAPLSQFMDDEDDEPAVKPFGLLGVGFGDFDEFDTQPGVSKSKVGLSCSIHSLIIC